MYFENIGLQKAKTNQFFSVFLWSFSLKGSAAKGTYITFQGRKQHLKSGGDAQFPFPSPSLVSPFPFLPSLPLLFLPSLPYPSPLRVRRSPPQPR